MVGGGASTLFIPGTPARRVLLRHQALIVQWVRALLAFRTAESGGLTDLTAERAAVEAARRALDEEEQSEAIPFVRVAKVLGLGQIERHALALIASPHLGSDIRQHIAAYWRSEGRVHVDGTLLTALFSTDDETAIAMTRLIEDGSRLQIAGLIELVTPRLSHVPSTLEQELVPTPRLLRLLDGEIGLDPRFQPFASLILTRADAAVGVVTEARLAELADLATAATTLTRRQGGTLLLGGSRGAGKLRVASALAARAGVPQLLVVESAFLPNEPSRLSHALAALAHEAELMAARLVLRRVHTIVDGARGAAVLRHVLSSGTTPVWLTSDHDPARIDAPHLLDLATIAVSVAMPDTERRRDAWQHELGRSGAELTAVELSTLSAEYPLSRSAIEIAAELGRSWVGSDAPARAISRAAESQLHGQLARYARRSRSRARLSEIVLTEDTREQVHELVVAVNQRAQLTERWGLAARHATGRGLVALFNGPPGTGKTLTASAIANEVELPLYRIDASSIMDRYVGETEKNLVRLFDEAAACRAALLFDEADALFGKRSASAEDANDRSANMQVNVLLNLIEDYDGFVVLTTNIKGAMDTAFLRRIVYKVTFEMPELEQIVALWDYHLPPAIPRAANLNLQALAEEFDSIAGGDVKNAVLRAALASGGGEVTQGLLRRALIAELRANGNVVADRLPTR